MYSASPSAQRGRPLSPLPPIGQRVVPFFDGWYGNSDGTITFSFGYSNLNREEVVTIPLGPDNFIEPKEYDGGQPIFFPPAIPDAPEGGARGGGAGSPADRRDRERGVFTVTVPAGFKGTVVWTLRNRGQSYSVPASAKTGAYRLQWPMAMGSTPPLLRFDPGGKTGRGPVGIHAAPLQTRKRSGTDQRTCPEAGDERVVVRTLRPCSRRLRPAETADRRTGGHSGDGSDLHTTGRVSPPRPGR
jgi:hypothetical protein